MHIQFETPGQPDVCTMSTSLGDWRLDPLKVFMEKRS